MSATAAIGLALAGVGAPAAVADSTGCNDINVTLGGCPTVTGTITGDQATIHATSPGAPGNPGTSSHRSSGTGQAPPSPVSTGCLDPACTRGLFTVSRLPTPTLDDLIGFRPTPATDHMEPNGWFIVNLDANFYATGGTSTQNGTLLGFPAAVRFTPVRWRWTYGDGTSATKATAGSTWAAQAIPEFDPTRTSHIYTQPGTYFIDLDVGYRAEYSFGSSGWASIDGMLWLPANRLVATVGGAKTVLVERDCTEVPTGPGC